MGMIDDSSSRCRVVLVSALAAVLVACGGSPPSDEGASDTEPSNSPTSSSTSEAPDETAAESAAPAVDFVVPTTLDESKFCSALDEAAVEAAMGVPIAKRATTGRDPKDLYCYYENKQQSVGVTVVWNRNPTAPVRETRKLVMADPSYAEAGCRFADVKSVAPDVAFQASCAGYDRSGSFFPKREEFFFQVGQTTLYCQLYSPPRVPLGSDAAGAASLCQDVVTSLT